jgi:hypothetical protein
MQLAELAALSTYSSPCFRQSSFMTMDTGLPPFLTLAMCTVKGPPSSGVHVSSLFLSTVSIRARIFELLWSPGIDSKASIPPAYVAWRAGTITLFLLGA